MGYLQEGHSTIKWQSPIRPQRFCSSPHLWPCGCRTRQRLLPPPCPWGSQGFMRSSWSLQPQKEEAGGAGCVEQGLELLRDVVALRCPAALQRGRFWSEFPSWTCIVCSVWIHVHPFVPCRKHHFPPGTVEVVTLVRWQDDFQPLAGHPGCVTTQHPPECIALHPLHKKVHLPLISTAGKHTMTCLFILPWRGGGIEKWHYFSYGNLGEWGLSEATRDVYSKTRSQMRVSLVLPGLQQQVQRSARGWSRFYNSVPIFVSKL